MTTASEPDFKQRYATHLKRLQLQGPRPKTIDAYLRAIRHLGAYFDERIDDLTEAQLTDYFSDQLASHSWSTVKHRLYGLSFYYTHVLHKPCPAPNLIKPPKVRRCPTSSSPATTTRRHRSVTDPATGRFWPQKAEGPVAVSH